MDQDESLERIATALERLANYVENNAATTPKPTKRKTKAELNQEQIVAEVEAPVEAAPVEAAPVEAAPVEAAPVEAAPVEAAPVASAPIVNKRFSNVISGTPVVKEVGINSEVAPFMPPKEAEEEPALVGEIISTKSQIEEFATDKEAFKKLRERVLSSYRQDRAAIVALLARAGVEKFDQLFNNQEKITILYGELLRHEHITGVKP
jgi:hypothetical protein